MDELENNKAKNKNAGKYIWIFSILLVFGIVFLWVPVVGFLIAFVGVIVFWLNYGSQKYGIRVAIVSMFVGISVLAAITSFTVEQYNHYRRNQSKKNCLNNLKELFGCLQEYNSIHGGMYPDALTGISDKSFTELLHCPQDKSRQEISYEYLGSGLTDGSYYSLIIMYDKEPWHKGQKRCVLFGDGHVKCVSEELFREIFEDNKRERARMGLAVKPQPVERY